MSGASAACVLADDEGALSRLPEVVELLVAASLAPIVAVVPRGTSAGTVPPPARSVSVESRRRDATSGLRFGLTQLLNAPVTGAIVLDARASVSLASLLAVLDASRRGAPMLVRGGEGEAVAWVHRDAWRDLLTAEQGMDEVARRYGVVRVPAVVLPPPA